MRIHKVLSGRCIGERPKFKFWVKSKGFCFLRCLQPTGRPSEMSGIVIALPNKVSVNTINVPFSTVYMCTLYGIYHVNVH